MRRLIGWWRMLWGFCPNCNSDSPEIWTCPVCKYPDIWPPSKRTRMERKTKWERMLRDGE